MLEDGSAAHRGSNEQVNTLVLEHVQLLGLSLDELHLSATRLLRIAFTQGVIGSTSEFERRLTGIDAYDVVELVKQRPRRLGCMRLAKSVARLVALP